MYPIYTSFQTVGSMLMTSSYSTKREAHVSKLQEHYHSDKADNTECTQHMKFTIRVTKLF